MVRTSSLIRHSKHEQQCSLTTKDTFSPQKLHLLFLNLGAQQQSSEFSHNSLKGECARKTPALSRPIVVCADNAQRIVMKPRSGGRLGVAPPLR